VESPSIQERDVFIAALQLESRAQRQAYLDRACATDPALRRQVEALLEAHDRAGNFLQEPVLGSVAAAALRDGPALPPPGALSPSRTGPRPEPSGETQDGATEIEPPSLEFLAPPQQPDELGRLGHYRVLRLLGQGGMGLVFLAEDAQLQRPVALKVMRPELAANAEGRQRFLREARAAAHVRSDHVVTIHHVEQEGNMPYLVMEVLHGQSLAEALEQRGRLPLGLCLRIARQTAEGLAAAHTVGLMHRDVKPSNVFLESRGQGTGDRGQSIAFLSPVPCPLSPVRVKLLDFGLARAHTSPQITRDHVIIGTPSYMAPEQAAGRPLDARCDLFSLGAVLYHMLTGQQPFPGDDVLAVLSSLANVTPPPAASLVPGLPAGVAHLLDRLLAKEPAGRPASAAEVANTLLALEKEAAGLAPSAGKLPEPPGAEATAVLPRPAAPRVRWRRRLVLAGGLGLIVLLAGLFGTVLIGVLHGRHEAPVRDEPDAAIAPAVLPIREFTLSGHGSQVQGLTFTADSRTLVSAEYWGGQVIYWDMERRVRRDGLSTARLGQLDAFAVDPHGHWLAIGLQSEIRLIHFGEHLAVGVLQGHTGRVTQLAFLKDGRTLLSTGYDGSIRRWDVKTQKQGTQLRAPGRRLDCFDAWEDGRGTMYLAYGGPNFVGVETVQLERPPADERPMLNDLRIAGTEDVQLERLSFQPLGVALSPDGTRLACPSSALREGDVALWQLPRTYLGVLRGATPPRGVAFTPDGKYVVVAGPDTTRIYEAAGGKQVAQVEHSQKAVSLAVSPDGQWLAVGTLKGPIRVWHLPSLLVPPGQVQVG
jgi:serine/threonine protein kinase